MPRLPKGAEKRDAQLTLRMTKSLRARIDRAAARDRRTPTDWILLALEDAAASSEAAADTKPKR